MESLFDYQEQLFYPECYYPQNMNGKHQLLTINPSCEKAENNAYSEAEWYFLNELKKYPQINEEFEIVSGVKVATDFGFIFPDIVLITKAGSFNNTPGNYFDIEIDEPYDKNLGTPTHYLENHGDRTTSIDKRHNDYLTNKGWTVIRFAEEQVLNNTFECVKFICKAQTMLETGSRLIMPSHKKSFPVKKWTKEESEQLYKRNH